MAQDTCQSKAACTLYSFVYHYLEQVVSQTHLILSSGNNPKSCLALACVSKGSFPSVFEQELP